MAQPQFWDEKERANRIVQELKDTRQDVEPWLKLEEEYRSLEELMGGVTEEDQSSLETLKVDLNALLKKVEELEFRTLLSGEEDKNNAILSINAGAGGTESCDWANMLLRMYSRWAQDKNYNTQLIDVLPGEEAGIKNATVLVKGDYAYGYLKSERGVHRLVRISPFDANKRRHTSFASVDVIPELSEEIKVDIDEVDLKIDTFRSSGPGGQHVNVTDSAVRITHISTGIVVQCQNERSQHKNKQTAMKILRSRLYERITKEREEKLAKEYAQKQKIEWGSQIRSYVMHPYWMVKDHRTELETSDVQGVMNGNIDGFIEAYLRKKPETLPGRQAGRNP